MDSIDLGALDGTDGFRLDGASRRDASGRVVSGAGDINGDGFADVINPPRSEGESYIVFGKAAGFSAEVSLAALDGSDEFRLVGIGLLLRNGTIVSSAKDINGDGYDDVIIGANSAEINGLEEVGESYVLFGKASGFTSRVDLRLLDGADGFRLSGKDARDRSGVSVDGAGDANDDGFEDLIVGARRGDPDGNSYAGESYVIFGFDTGAVMHQGTNVDETLTGDGSANAIIGDMGDDTLVGAGGADVFRGDAGVDILSVDDLTFADADGGTGTDTLRFAAANLSLDLTVAGDKGLSGIEAFDFASTNSSLTESPLSILALSETSNTVTITGDSDDTVSFSDSGWSFTLTDAIKTTISNGQAQLVINNDIVLAGVGEPDDTVLTVAVTLDDAALQAGEATAVTLTFSEAVTGFDNSNITVPNGTLSTVSSSDGGRIFAATYTPGTNVKDAINVINVGTGYTDAARNAGAAADGANFTIDTVAPTVTVALEDVALTTGEASTVTFAFSEAMIGFDNSDISVSNGTLSTVSSSDGGATFTATYKPDGNVNDATNVISVGAGYTDIAGNAGAAADSPNFTIDTPPDGDPTDDLLAGGTGEGIFSGGAGVDRLFGAGGSDTLNGSDGDDLIVGGGDGDLMTSGHGRDPMLGNAGADQFICADIADSTTARAGQDRIFGLVSGDGDKIGHSAIDAIASSGADDAFTFVGAFTGEAGQLIVQDNGAAVIVAMDVTGDGAVDAVIFVQVAALDAGDFIL
jgi:Ca2+-binding RTX toxin-like protein